MDMWFQYSRKVKFKLTLNLVSLVNLLDTYRVSVLKNMPENFSVS